VAEVTLEELERNPHELLARLRSTEPVAWIDALGAWLVTSRDLALTAMRSPELFTVDDPRFSTGRVVGRSMLTTEGDEQARHRAPFAQRFRLRAVREKFSQSVAREVDRLIDAFEPRGAAELRAEFAGPLAAAIATQAVGLDDPDRALDWYRVIVHATTEVTRGDDVTPEARAAVTELREAVGDDQDPGDVATLLFGGIETTEGMIANALMHLLTHPHQLEAVRADPSKTAGAIEESLRLEPAAATIDRYATQDTTFGGAHIRQHDLVTISIAAANRDPHAFEEPDRFDITRANARQHLAFAHGPHVCIGMHLARLEAHTAVNRVLARLPDLELDQNEPPPAATGLVFRKPAAVQTKFTPPSPSRERMRA
jgi:cytochrome P450